MQKPMFTKMKLNTLPKLHKIQYIFFYLFAVAESPAESRVSECEEEQTYVPFSGNDLSYHLHDS
jgi:hypothetical protein